MTKHHREQFPFHVALQRVQAPCDVIVIWPKKGRSFRSLRIEEGTLDDTLRSFQGGGGPSTELRADQAITIFVTDPNTQISGIGAPENTAYLRVGRRSHGLVYINWSDPDRPQPESSLCVIWSSLARERGAPPVMFVGTEADAMYRHAHGRTSGLPSAALGSGRAVRSITRRQVRERLRLESEARKKVSKVTVTSIRVSGLRGFSTEARLGLATPNGHPGSGLTLVVGANNTGKSTLWESFDAVARKIKHDVSFSEGQRNRRAPEGVKILVDCEDGSQYSLQSLTPDTSETRGRWQTTTGDRELEIVTVPSRRQFQAHFSKNSNPDRTWMIGGQEFNRQRQMDNGFTGRLFALHENLADKAQFDSLLTEVLGHELSWSIDLGDGPHGQNYYLKVASGDGVSHSSEGLGDGIVSLLYILNALFDSTSDSILVFDEPELSLHPQMVRNLGKVLAEFAKIRQIVVFTHSPILVSWDSIASGAEIARVYKEGTNSRVAQVPRPTIDQLSKARGSWHNPHVLGADATEALFLEDQIIVVEGQEDRALLPQVFEQAGVEPQGTVFGWGTGGGDGNPRRIVALLHGLGFRKVVALLDADKEREVEAIQQLFPEYLALTIPANDIHDKRARDDKAKTGLLDEDGKSLKPELVDATRERLGTVVSYFKRPID